jgi:hypothetical protein
LPEDLQRLSNIYEDLCLVTPSKDSYFLSFYTLSKVYKNLVRARPITGAFDSLTSRASKAASDGLEEIYKILSIQAQTQGFTSALTICIKTENIIKRANTAIQAYTNPQGLSFTIFDFDGMCNHDHQRHQELSHSLLQSSIGPSTPTCCIQKEEIRFQPKHLKSTI